MNQSASEKIKAIALVNKKYSIGLNSSNTSFSNINSKKTVWWFVIDNAKFTTDLHLLMNDQNKKILYYFLINGNSIKNPKTTFRQRNNNRSHFEIRIGDNNFTDIFNGFQFREYLREKIEY